MLGCRKRVTSNQKLAVQRFTARYVSRNLCSASNRTYQRRTFAASPPTFSCDSPKSQQPQRVPCRRQFLVEQQARKVEVHLSLVADITGHLQNRLQTVTMNGSTATKHWHPPAGTDQSQLFLLNTLTDKKEPFVPAAGPKSKQVTWYICGPTVYDVSHLGHARNYLTFDIIRRVLEDYFGYHILFVMNVTDVDDKIILRARRNYLLSQYRSASPDASQVKAYADTATETAVAKQEEKIVKLKTELEAEKGQKKKDDLKEQVENEEVKLENARKAVAGLKELNNASVDAILKVAGDYVAEALDKEKGSNVTDQDIYLAHTRKYEREFFEDMDALGWRRPDVVLRVTEYIPEIVSYIQQIIQNGLGYESNGSVYFDTSSFRAAGHTYGKLKPTSVGSATLAAEGEGNFETREKRNPTDFALWKASKAGEPWWESPWGNGRPGWHIECSAMASNILGPKIDMHSGGSDLMFPHHDNEIAQAEAHYHHQGCCEQWVNYWLHSGHLHIKDRKMSKSLKNFITIREALQEVTARQMRLMFLLNPWQRPMSYNDTSFEEMRAKESLLKNFFQNVDVVLRNVDVCATSGKWQPREFELSRAVSTCQEEVHKALQDNIDTRGAMDRMGDMIKAVNIYLAAAQQDGSTPNPSLLRRAASFVSRILAVFGLSDVPADKLGFGDMAAGSGAAAASKYLDAFSSFRDEMRAMARAKADPREYLTACDKLRDDVLPELGVRLEDRGDGKAVWKLDDPEVLRAEREEKLVLAAAAARKKLEGALQRKQADRDKLAGLAALCSVQEALADKYRFDDNGEPTHDKDGNELEGKAKDKARKDIDKALKVREPYTKRMQEDPNCMAALDAEIGELQAQLVQLALSN